VAARRKTAPAPRPKADDSSCPAVEASHASSVRGHTGCWRTADAEPPATCGIATACLCLQLPADVASSLVGLRGRSTGDPIATDFAQADAGRRPDGSADQAQLRGATEGRGRALPILRHARRAEHRPLLLLLRLLSHQVPELQPSGAVQGTVLAVRRLQPQVRRRAGGLDTTAPYILLCCCGYARGLCVSSS